MESGILAIHPVQSNIQQLSVPTLHCIIIKVLHFRQNRQSDDSDGNRKDFNIMSCLWENICHCHPIYSLLNPNISLES